MGQKVNPNSLRFGLNKNWVSRWNAPDKKHFIKWLLEDEKVRDILKKKCRKCGVGHIEIERFVNLDETITTVIYLHLVQPALLLTNEKEMSAINKDLKRCLGKHVIVKLEVLELANPAVSAEIVGQEVVDAIQNRSPHRLIIKRAMKKSMTSGAKGIKVKVSGRINGVEIARSETYVEGSVPLSTLRADIDYSFQIAKTSYGILGVKVWINRGLYFGKHFMPLPAAPFRMKRKNESGGKENKFIANTY